MRILVFLLIAIAFAFVVSRLAAWWTASRLRARRRQELEHRIRVAELERETGIDGSHDEEELAALRRELEGLRGGGSR
ncbi:MAG TPA: hypothetical protein VM290_07000 [Gaiellaceae bacterium]|jgi:predicted lysophospholipase L1 biosynthesis ABC-type transport system permease subunit|nr:hypothetical protein [Gaiellaceae bacterium]